ncbi:MAG: trypsin-like serine protease [Minicystis sp.]
MSFRRTLTLPLLGLLAACTTAGGDPERTATAQQPIIGGIPDTFRSYVVGVGDNQGVICTGTLISRRTVITAGHCYSQGKPKGGITKVYFGNSVALASAPTVVNTAQAVRMPGYNDTSLHNDLTLVQLAGDAPTQPAPILRETLENTPEWIGPNFTFVGYGNDGSFNYDTRRVAVFPISKIGPASDVGIDTGSGPIDETMFYFRVPKKNTCDGDSGGPAFVVRGGVEYHAGSTSYGDGPCKVDGVDQRTDLPAINAFIQATIDQFEGTDPCRADGVCDESCNANNTLVDPDCAPNHCGADGMCVISCVDPPDPDCPAVDHCSADGVCDPTCASTDFDCIPPPTPDAGTMDAGGTGGIRRRGHRDQQQRLDEQQHERGRRQHRHRRRGRVGDQRPGRGHGRHGRERRGLQLRGARPGRARQRDGARARGPGARVGATAAAGLILPFSSTPLQPGLESG